MTDEQKVEKLYKEDKIFRKLHQLMFCEFGWAATEIDKDILKIYDIVKKYKRS